MPTLLVVHHSPTPAVRRLTDAVLAGAHDELITGVEVHEREALAPDVDEAAAADGFVLVTSANFGYMSGALKHWFDSVFLAIGGALGDDGGAAGSGGAGGRRPYGLLLHGRHDVEGARRAVASIAGALPWRQAADVVGLLGEVGGAECAAAYELGATIAALLAEGTYQD